LGRKRWKDNIKIDLREKGYEDDGCKWLKIRLNGGLQ
jgi:hypothetical protein